MAKSTHRKKHKKKVENRRKRIEDDKQRVKKAQRNFIEELIKREKENGAFDNTPSIDTLNTNSETPIIEVEGPSI